MNRKVVPLLLALISGAIMLIVALVKDYSLPRMLFSLLVIMASFSFVGLMIESMLNYFDKDNMKRAALEGEVVEKKKSEEQEINEEVDEIKESEMQEK